MKRTDPQKTRERRAHVAKFDSDAIDVSVYKRAYGQRRPPLIPPNYSGNAFASGDRQAYGETESELKEDRENAAGCDRDVCLSCEHAQSCAEKECEDNCEKKEHAGSCGEKSLTQSPFPGIFKNGIGSEELLILALIFMTANGGDDILPYLVLLLFA